MELKLNYMQRKSDECSSFLDEMKTSYTQQVRIIEEKYKKSLSSSMDFKQTTYAMDQLANKFKRRFNCLKETTSKLFEQQDTERYLLHERILWIEISVKNLQEMNNKTSKAQPKCLFSDESTSDDPFPSKPTYTRSFS